MRHPLICYFSLADGISWLVWGPLWLPALGVRGLTVLPFHHALGALGPIAGAFIVSAVDAAFTSGASSPIVINTAGGLITLWGIAVVLMAGPRRLASLTSQKEHAS